MANALFDAGREGFLNGTIDWDTNEIRLVCVDHADDVPLPASDNALDDILPAARVATSGAFASKTTTAGVADAADVTLTSVTGDQFESIVIYQYNVSEPAALLIAFIDTATGLPCTPNGGDITVQWDSGTNRIFKL